MSNPEPRCDERKFSPGDMVKRKFGSYTFYGEVLGSVATRAGKVRYVVEHETETGMLHIFQEEDLILQKEVNQLPDCCGAMRHRFQSGAVYRNGLQKVWNILKGMVIQFCPWCGKELPK